MLTSSAFATGQDGQGPFGTTPPPWATDSVANAAWRSGPWTAWWGGTACPPADWPGWTAGPWSSLAPWTSWSACEASTTATTVGTATVNGSAVVTTAFGLRVAAATMGVQGSTGGSGARVTHGVGAVLGVALVGVVVGL
ncbi:hypothetical protein BDU57DRAFT_511293 [Ampelomyces quisqualis]|uniref:Uncharacterized protein n=1 Tax=Ampelomyces quisqualis TaxID=50730 RepID=A0A6A5QT61_AMPQU|nr:hypothetical protein BDU57DRAFT_511293 [Ampelomyces quisqualis]